MDGYVIIRYGLPDFVGDRATFPQLQFGVFTDKEVARVVVDGLNASDPQGREFELYPVLVHQRP